MTGIILLVITRIDEPDLPQLVFLLACVGLLNIYVQYRQGRHSILFFLPYLVIISLIGTPRWLIDFIVVLYFEYGVPCLIYLIALAIWWSIAFCLFHRFVVFPRVVRLLEFCL